MKPTRIARRERLLDAAERRFAEIGYEGTALCNITSAAGTRLASMTDEFGGKEHLFREVLLRRALPLEADRLRMLDAIADHIHGARRTGAIIDASAHPMPVRLPASRKPSRRRRLQPVARPFVDAFTTTFPGSGNETAYDA